MTESYEYVIIKNSKTPATLVVFLNIQAAEESKMSSECTLYRDVNFSGAQLTLRREMSELKQQGFNDAASSAKIMGTPWIFYKDTSFMGTSYIVKPGSYPNPSTWGGDNDTLSSHYFHS